MASSPKSRPTRRRFVFVCGIGAIVATALVMAWSAYGHLSGMLAPLAVSREAQLAFWALVILVALVAAIRLRERWVAALTRGLDVVAAVLVAITSFQIARYVLTRPAPGIASALPGPSAPSMFRWTPGCRSAAASSGRCPGVMNETTSWRTASA